MAAEPGDVRDHQTSSVHLAETDSIRIATKCKAEENTKLLKDWPTESCAHDALCPTFRQTPVLEKKKCQLILKGISKAQERTTLKDVMM